jgi:hypothetical protein
MKIGGSNRVKFGSAYRDTRGVSIKQLISRFNSRSYDIHGDQAIGCGVVSELAVVVVSPAFDSASFCEGASVIEASRYCRDSRT